MSRNMIAELQLNENWYKIEGDNKKGMVLPGVLVILSLIVLVASIAVTLTFTEIKISGNYKFSKQAFYIAEARCTTGLG